MNVTEGLRLAPAVAVSRLLGGPPYKLLLALTDRCTHQCLACRTWTVRPGNELRPAEVARVLRGAPGLRWLDLSGGEIVARPDALALADAVAAEAERLVFLHFATNGWEPARVHAFAQGLRRARGPRLVVTVSVDGDEALHDRLRGRPGAFRRALETARALGDLPRTEVYLGTTITPENADALPRVAEALAAAAPELVPARWHVNLMTRSAHFFRNADQPGLAPAQALEAARAIERLRGRPRDAFAWVERVFLRALRGYLSTGEAPAPCQALRASVFVGPSGDVYPCHIRSQALGNLRQAGYALPRILHGAAGRAARARLAPTTCAGCWTPCEAYHAMIAAPLRASARAWRAETALPTRA